MLAGKIFLAELCVVPVSSSGRWGVAIAGVLGGLPVAGPILLVETLRRGDTFGADAAGGTLLGGSAAGRSLR